MTIYRGLGGVNRELKQQFRGLSGVNREIKDQYRGSGGVNRKVFSGLPPIGTPLSLCSWDEINAISQEGLAASYWAVGAEKDIVVNGETLTVQIYGFNHDNLVLGGKAGITFGLKHLMATGRRMNPPGVYNESGWAASAIRIWANGTFIEQMPSDLQAVIKTVNKLTSEGNQSATINTTQDNAFLFSEVECFGSNPNSKVGEGTKYTIFTGNASRIKKMANGVGAASTWWERSPHGEAREYFLCVRADGTAYWYQPTFYNGVTLGFCV